MYVRVCVRVCMCVNIGVHARCVCMYMYLWVSGSISASIRRVIAKYRWQICQRYSAFSDTSSRILMGNLLTNKENVLSNYERFLSPYVFILCVEILSQTFINNKEVVGLRIGDREQKWTQFADDTTLFLNGSKKALIKSIALLNIYKEASGLRMNLSKTKAIWTGSKRFSKDKICHEVELDWVQTFTALGIKYNVTDLCGITDLNCATKMAEVEKFS